MTEQTYSQGRLLQMALASLPITVLGIDDARTLRLAEGKGVLDLGLHRSLTLGASIDEVFADVPQVVHNFTRALSGESMGSPIRVGRHLYYSHYGPLRDEEGHIIGAIEFVLDMGQGTSTDDPSMSGRRRDELDSSLFRAVFEKIGIGVVLTDLEGRIVSFNAAFRAMVGYSEQELHGMTVADIVVPDDLAKSEGLHRKLLAGEGESYRLEGRLASKDGAIISTQSVVAPISGTHEVAPLFLVVVEDVTRQKQAEEELAEIQRRLMRGREMERTILAQDLHDGPLQDIIGVSYQLRALADSLPDREFKTELDAIQTVLGGVTRRIRGIASQLRPPALASFGLGKAIQSHVIEFEEDHPDVRVSFELALDRPELSDVTQLALFRIYQESMKNAAQHSGASEIIVRLFAEGTNAVLEIRDNGVGFSPPIHMVDLARDGHYGMLGAAERAEAIGGKLEIESQPGSGTLVRAVVPLSSDADDLSKEDP